ncbi:unnamed protein product, partial [Ectocarpus sp. 12 AP-2014]
MQGRERCPHFTVTDPKIWIDFTLGGHVGASRHVDADVIAKLRRPTHGNQSGCLQTDTRGADRYRHVYSGVLWCYSTPVPSRTKKSCTHTTDHYFRSRTSYP